MIARQVLPLAVAGTLLLLPVACGSTAKPATDLQIRVHDFQKARTYRLSCEPADGTVPRPVAACKALDAQRGLLVDGIGFDHSCPGGPWTEVVGSSRGKDFSITFASCNTVPGQAAVSDWLELVGYRPTGPNRYGHASSNALLQSVGDRRRADQTRARLQRRQEEQQLPRHRRCRR